MSRHEVKAGAAASAEGVTAPPWHALSAPDVVARLGSDAAGGLAADTASERLGRHGPNRLVAERQVTFWGVAREEVTEPMILLLLAVGLIYAWWGELRDALAIFVIVCGITFVEVFNEYRAKAAIASLRRLGALVAPVVRGGIERKVPATDVVLGDLVLLSPGERVPADLRLVEAIGLRIDESGLTGESAPVMKDTAPVAPATELADRQNVAHAGTLVRAGKGKGIVVATGMATEIGRIAGLVKAAREPRTPLQVAMRQLSGWLVYLAIGFSVAVPALGLLFGQPLRAMVLTGLTLAFATIPEEMPILITVVLGLGALRLARRRVIVKRLRAAETLGSVTHIASDKTGTMTENRMSVAALHTPGRRQPSSVQEAGEDADARLLLELAVLANDARVGRGVQHRSPADGDEFFGDPTDTALLAAAVGAGLDARALRGDGPIEEFTFDDRKRLMSATYRREGYLLVAAKGAPESILARCLHYLHDGTERELGEPARRAALDAAEGMAARGLRVLAFAYLKQHSEGAGGTHGARPAAGDQDGDIPWVYAGLAGLIDPPRVEVPRAVGALRAAGIRVLMLTGDHAATARAVASTVGIESDLVMTGREVEAMDNVSLGVALNTCSVFARIAPEHKLRIVQALQAQGATVAVTGDGVNDAPALKAAAIGVAMGETGTDVAKEAADMVLGDDNFATIAVAVREGRKLFANLRKAVRYYLAVKVALVSSALIGVLAHLPVPFSPIQIIITELFMDLGASVAFTAEPPEGDVMATPPRDPKLPFMERSMQVGIFAGGLSLCTAVIAVYLGAHAAGAEVARAQTLAFVTWMIGHVLLALQMRSERQPLLSAGPFSNRAMLLWAVAAVGFSVVATSTPVLQSALKLTPLSAAEWLTAMAVPLVTTSWWEVWKGWRWRVYAKQRRSVIESPE